jgi:hypothetical protein
LPVGKANAPGSPSRASFSSAGPAGVRQAEHPRALVERLAGGVVERLAEHGEAVVLGHAARNVCPPLAIEAQERRLERVRPEEVRGDVALQVVDGRERQPARGGDPLRGRDADEQRADEARAPA